MRVLVTGAQGFVGQAVVEAIAADPACFGAPVTELVLTDRDAGQSEGRWLPGDLSDPAHIAQLIAEPVDVLIHLASLPGGGAEANPDLGRAVNLTAPLALNDALARQHRAGGPRARVVFASTIATFGPLGPDPVGPDHATRPAISYGAHKLMTEIDIADLSRRGDLDGVSLRLPGIVARPLAALAGFGSAFISEVFHRANAREEYALPVSREATTWWMSRPTVVANILHAARLDTGALGPDRLVLLPALFASVGDVIDGLGDHFAPEAIAGFTHAPDAGIEALFGAFPEIDTTVARALGFHMDENVAALIASVLEDLK